MFTENGELLVSLQGLFSCEGQIKPARASQVHLHCAPEDLNVWWSSFYGLSTNLHPHARHHHRAVIVDHLHCKSTRLRKACSFSFYSKNHTQVVLRGKYSLEFTTKSRFFFVPWCLPHTSQRSWGGVWSAGHYIPAAGHCLQTPLL